MAAKKIRPKVALITGVTGQDGAYLAEFLLKTRDTSCMRLSDAHRALIPARIDHLYQDPHEKNRNFILHYGDMTDTSNLIRIVQTVQPDEIYNLAAQSHVAVSFETPEYTANADGLGTLRLLEAIRILGLTKKTKFYQASTSEMFGKAKEFPQKETTPFHPRSPYGAAKVYAILDNGKLPRSIWNICLQRNPFQSRIPYPRRNIRHTQNHSRCCTNPPRASAKRYLGNLDALRDWGHAREYVEAQWRISAAFETRRLCNRNWQTVLGSRHS
jgi:GDPmannose 4,6-dehydratase